MLILEPGASLIVGKGARMIIRDGASLYVEENATFKVHDKKGLRVLRGGKLYGSDVEANNVSLVKKKNR